MKRVVLGTLVLASTSFACRPPSGDGDCLLAEAPGRAMTMEAPGGHTRVVVTDAAARLLYSRLTIPAELVGPESGPLHYRKSGPAVSCLQDTPAEVPPATTCTFTVTETGQVGTLP